MTPFHADPWLTIYGGDCRAVLREMEPESVNCVVTSPPYWGLRDYGTAGQLGLEPTPEEYVATMVDVFREVRRVLRADGTLWLNLGDSYAASLGQRKATDAAGTKQLTKRGSTGSPSRYVDTLKPKDLVGIPWRVAFALQADGWWLRSDIIWSKPNPMPESITDRPTKSHEYLFLLAKSARYFYDADAVREADKGSDHDRTTLRGQASLEPSGGLRGPHAGIRRSEGRNGAGRNRRSVWTIATAPYPGAHFATFPPKIVEPCILAGCPQQTCSECGAPWERVTRADYDAQGRTTNGPRSAANRAITAGFSQRLVKTVETLGFRPTCKHYPRTGEWVDYRARKDETDGEYRRRTEPIRLLHAELLALWATAATATGVVLDPFAGTGTVGMVAQQHSRRAVLIDLNPDYLRQCLARNAAMPLGLA